MSGVAFQRVARAVVDVVRRHPPRDADAVEEVSNAPPDHGVFFAIISDRCVPSIVADEHTLLPKQTEQDGAEHVRLETGARRQHARQHAAEKHDQSRDDEGVIREIALQQLLTTLHRVPHPTKRL